MKNEKHYRLYVLKLEQGKYYVGITTKTPESRFKEHVSGFYGAEWTKIYKPINIDRTVDLGVTTIERTEEYENNVTRKYIKEYGLDNVRGGNLTYRGKYVKRFGYYYPDRTWEIIYNLYIVEAVITLMGLYIAIDYLFDKKILGLWP